MKKLASIFGVSNRVVFYTLLLILFFVATFAAFTTITNPLLVQYSSLPIGLTKALLGIILWKLIDDTVFGTIDTPKEILKNNSSYAITQLSSAIIIALCVALS
jgi:hypothetical protein